jgi:acyl-coenzyme A thioesterase PaaI-like protein
LGEVQLVKADPSSAHPKVEFDSDDEKVKLADVVVTVPDGPEPIDVSGGVVSGGAAAVVKDQVLSLVIATPVRSLTPVLPPRTVARYKLLGSRSTDGLSVALRLNAL